VSKSAVIAVGGNSLIRAGERGTVQQQYANARRTARSIVPLLAEGWTVVITHGNGPQVGAALLRSERAANEVYSHPLDMCVATTQSEIGYLLKRALESELASAGIAKQVVVVLTQVRVEESDDASNHPTKPVGPFYSKDVAEEKQRVNGWVMVEDATRGYRRVVPSPEPLEVLEKDVIRRLMEWGVIVIALGGGGIPVRVRNGRTVEGVEAVIDKDRASAVLAIALGVDDLLISTDVDHVYLDYRKPSQRPLTRATVEQMQGYCVQGHFPPGNMGPKVESALRFLRAGGRRAIITSSERLVDAVHERTGTIIVP
jgi:carbamate kinase